MILKRSTSPLALPFGSHTQRADDSLIRDTLDQLSEGFLLVAPRTGLFHGANRRASEMTGYTREELERLSLSELFSGPEAAPALEEIRRLDYGTIHALQNVPMRTKSGRIAQVDIRAGATQSQTRDRDKADLVCLFIKDPEQRVMLERAETHHHHSFAALVEIINLIMAELQAPAADMMDRLLAACRRYAMCDAVAVYRRTDGFPGFQLSWGVDLPEEFPAVLASIDPAGTGAPFVWRVPERATSLLARAARNSRYSILHALPIGLGPETAALVVLAYRSASYQTFETQVVAEAVTRFVSAALYATQAVTDRLRQQAEIEDIDRQFHIMLNETEEGILRVDGEGRVAALNRTAEILLGFRLTDTRGRSLEDVLISPQPLAQPMLLALKEGQRWGSVETDLIRRDGNLLPASVRAVPLAQPGTTPGGIIFITDRTDQRAFQVKSNELEQRAWLGEIASIFAHEVRNPLFGIGTGLNYMADKFETGTPLHDSISAMQAEVTRIDALVKSMLSISKASALEPQPTPIPPLVQRVLARWVTRLARRNISVEPDMDPRTPLALADANQLEQVLTNLINNAMDAMTDRVDATLGVKCHAATHPQRPTHGEYVQITIGDTGPGIPEETRARIFDSFFTTKATGTGLGLAITKRIITAHKGAMVVETWPGIGSMFHVFIPVAHSQSQTHP